MDSAEQTVRALFDRVWNEGDLDAVDDLLAAEYVIHSDPGDPWEGQTLDAAGFKRRLTVSRAPFPDLRFEILEMLSDGDRVAVSWLMRGTNTGPMGERPPTGKSIAVRGMTIYYLTDGRISGHSQAFDRLAIAQQLGMLA